MARDVDIAPKMTTVIRKSQPKFEIGERFGAEMGPGWVAGGVADGLGAVQPWFTLILGQKR